MKIIIWCDYGIRMEKTEWMELWRVELIALPSDEDQARQITEKELLERIDAMCNLIAIYLHDLFTGRRYFDRLIWLTLIVLGLTWGYRNFFKLEFFDDKPIILSINNT